MINILVALNAEAKPIRQALKLNSVQDSAPWRCYENDQYRLVVTGTGSLNMAIATSWLYGAYGSATLWVNIGTTGQKTAELGSVVVANKIVDQKSGQTWFVPILAKNLPTVTISTVERAQSKFSDENFYDMEAAGFMQAALHVAERERIHCIKIVSDNEIDLFEDLVEAQLTQLVEVASQTILLVIKRLSDSLKLASPPYSPDSELRVDDIDLATLRRISSAQQHRWRELKRRWLAVGWPVESLREKVDTHKSTTDFLNWMEKELYCKPISLEKYS